MLDYKTSYFTLINYRKHSFYELNTLPVTQKKHSSKTSICFEIKLFIGSTEKMKSI